MLAMVNQKVGVSVRLGQANWVLYKIAQTKPVAFHSMQSSNNSVYCSAGSPDCGANNFLTGYNTASGYNLATGLGSVDVTALVNAWESDSLTPTTTTLTLDKTNFTHGTPVNIGVVVNPSAATGDVAVVNNASAQNNATSSSSSAFLPLAGGAASGSFAQFPGGTYTIYGNYGGDGNYAGSASQGVQVTVAPEDTVLQFSVNTINSAEQLTSLSGAAVPLGTYTILHAVPLGKSQASSNNPVANATGSVYFIDTYTGGGGSCGENVNLDSTGSAEADFPTCGAGSHSIAAQYNGDLSYNLSTAGPINFSVSKASTSVTLTSTANSIGSGNILLNLTITPSWESAGVYPTGSVTFTDTTSNSVMGTSTAEANSCNSGNSICVTTVFDLYPQNLFLGPNVITATYRRFQLHCLCSFCACNHYLYRRL